MHITVASLHVEVLWYRLLRLLTLLCYCCCYCSFCNWGLAIYHCLSLQSDCLSPALVADHDESRVFQRTCWIRSYRDICEALQNTHTHTHRLTHPHYIRSRYLTRTNDIERTVSSLFLHLLPPLTVTSDVSLPSYTSFSKSARGFNSRRWCNWYTPCIRFVFQTTHT